MSFSLKPIVTALGNMTSSNFTSNQTDSVTNPISRHTNLNTVLYITETGAEVSPTYFIVCIFSIIFAIFMIFFNAIVIYTLICHKRSTSVTDYFVSSLSIADLTTGIVVLYNSFYSLLQFQNRWECLFRFSLVYTVSQSSFMHILAISVDRYVKIVYPLSSVILLSKSKVIMISLAIWVLSFVLGMLPLFGWHKEFRVDDNAHVECRFFGLLPDGYFHLNLYVSLATAAVTALLYGRIAYEARQHYHRLQELAPASVGQALFDEQAWRLAKTISVVVIVSNLCWIPAVVLVLLHTSGQLDHLSVDVKGDLATYCGLTAFLNSLINPLIYACKITEVKRTFQRIFCCVPTSFTFVMTTSQETADL